MSKREYNREWMRKWYSLNKETGKLRSDKWRKDNPEKVREMANKFRIKHREKIRAYAREYARLNRSRYQSKRTAYQAKRKAIQRNATSGDLGAIAKIYARAKELKRWFDVCVDHIIPLSKGGTHSPDNLQIIYFSENSSKKALLDYKPRVIFA